jgi:rubredoxin
VTRDQRESGLDAGSATPSFAAHGSSAGTIVGIQRDAVRALLAQPAHSRLAGEAYAFDARTRLRRVRDIDHVIHLPPERGDSAERFRVEDLHEHRAAPAFGRVRAAEAGESRSQRFDEERQPEALVAGVEPAQRQQRAAGIRWKALPDRRSRCPGCRSAMRQGSFFPALFC